MTEAFKMEMPYKTVIVANGAFPSCSQALDFLRHAGHIICCDGAVGNLTSAGFSPSVIVGDLDSLSPDEQQRWSDRLHPDYSTEYNDLQKALKYAIAQQMDNIVLLGCAGGREDHFIANLSIMATYGDRLNLLMVTDNGLFRSIRQTTTLPAVPGQQVSVFTKDETLPLTFHGLKYPVSHRCFRHLWEGSLNEATENAFTIEMHGEGVIVVYQTWI